MACLSSTIMYSETGDGKTGAVGSFAKWIKLRTGKMLRLYTAEPDIGTIEHLIGECIDVTFIKDRPNACETIALASQGWWPSQETVKGVWEGPWQAPQPGIWSSIGANAYEGGTEFGNAILEELRVLGAAGSIVSAEKAPAQFTSGGMKCAGNNQTHYGIAQGRLKEAINASQKLPVHVLWTARILRVEDKQETGNSFEKQYVYGPLLAGKAATADVPAWFGNCIHIDMVKTGQTKDKSGKMVDVFERRAYLQKHFDEGSTVPYPAKMRVPPEMSKEVPPYIVLTDDLEGMVRLFDSVEVLRAKAREKTQQQLAVKQ